ncbi:hypothetical protein ES703_37017 [subsurface metagenome]
MPRERLADVLHRVDPNLHIVEARPWPGKMRSNMNQADWDNAAGLICKSCHNECFRSRDGLCIKCWDTVNEIEIRDTSGWLSAWPEEIIMGIVKQAKKEE